MSLTDSIAESTFFHLDAHWDDDLPLRNEVQVIVESWKIDDFQVPDDLGNGFDDYGGEKTISLSFV